ncbi:MAG: hypothetical protein KJ821_01640 [Actinobacteria bacterium]|nr:hypothetical protein [Actinomycetota bacterium]
MVILDDIKLDIPEDVGKDFLNKLMGGRLNPPLEKLLKEKREVCVRNIYPKLIYKEFEIEKVKDESVYFKTGNIFNGPNISKILTGSEITIIFISTLGNKIDEIIIEENKSGDTLSTIVMDAISTSLLVTLGEYAGHIIKKDGIKYKSWGSTCNYSPGQFKWTIEEQKELFNMVEGSRIGVKLNESFLMAPFKSTSGVYGFGPKDKIDKTRVACDLCPRENCIGRR